MPLFSEAAIVERRYQVSLRFVLGLMGGLRLSEGVDIVLAALYLHTSCYIVLI